MSDYRAAVSIRWVREKDGLYEQRRKVVAVVECPRCGADVDLKGETEEWHLKSNRWHHTCYGPGQGEHCGLLLVDTFEGAFAYKLPVEVRR